MRARNMAYVCTSLRLVHSLNWLKIKLMLFMIAIRKVVDKSCERCSHDTLEIVALKF